MPWVLVMGEPVVGVSAKVLPSTLICSCSPSNKPLTVKLRRVIICPWSTALTCAPVNTATAAPCALPAPSVKVLAEALAVKVGASLVATILTI